MENKTVGSAFNPRLAPAKLSTIGPVNSFCQQSCSNPNKTKFYREVKS